MKEGILMPLRGPLRMVVERGKVRSCNPAEQK